MIRPVQDIAFDMETSDPDDVFTLSLLATHPWATLRAVTVTPGTLHQIGVVRHVLERLGRTDVRVGARDAAWPKQCVSAFHYKWLGPIAPSDPDDVAHNVLAEAIQQWPRLTLVTGGPLGNVGALLTHHPELRLPTVVIQGGFAGDPVVPPEWRLEKFLGRETCPTYNLNGDPAAATMVLVEPIVGKRYLVSKNVCHGVVYDAAMHARLDPHRDAHPGLTLVHEGMQVYLRNRPEGKKFHDPLAAMVALDREVCVYREVEMYRVKGEWGARLSPGTNTFISVWAHRDQFEKALWGGY